MLSASALSQHGVNLVDEDDAGLQLPGEAEDGIDQLVAVAVPLFRQGGDVQVDEAGARLVGKGFGEHRLAAARRAVEQHARGGAEQRRTVGVEVGHGEGVDDRLLELFDDGVEAANVCVSSVLPAVAGAVLGARRTLEADGNLLGRHHLHGNRLLVRVEVEVLYPRAAVARVCLVIAVVLAVALAALAGQDGVELAGGGRCLGAGLFLLLGVGVEAREQVADDKVGDQRLCGGEFGSGCGRGERTAAAAMRMSGR